MPRSRLGGPISWGAGIQHRAEAGRDIDDPSPALAHQGQGSLGHPPGAVDYAVRFDHVPRPALLIDHSEAVSRALDPLDCDPSVDRDPDPLGLAVHLCDRIRIHVVEQPR
jgi:hypothetical protein